jgi:hypothetical protein
MTTSLGPPVPPCVPRPDRFERHLCGTRLAFVLATSCLCFAGHAVAHEYWLSPSSYQAKPKSPVEFGAGVGTGFRGERKAFSATRCVRFIARADKMLDLILTARDNDPMWGRFSPTDDGGLMVGYESNYASIELPASQFDAYLELEGLTQPLETRRKAGGEVPGRERYRRCAKTWLAGDDDRRAAKPLGLPLEIIPLSAPGAEKSLKMKVEFLGRPLRDALVKAWRTPLASGSEPTNLAARDSVPVVWQGRTDRKGEVVLRTEDPGEWLVSVVHMTASRDSIAADWESTWSSLTFSRMGAPVMTQVQAAPAGLEPAQRGR